MRIGVVGYGTGGRHFHTPFLEAAEGVELAGVVTRSPRRRAELAGDWPGVPAYASLAEVGQEMADAAARAGVLLNVFAAAVRGMAEEPVPAAQGIRTLEVLDAARRSAQEGTTVVLIPAVGAAT